MKLPALISSSLVALPLLTGCQPPLPDFWSRRDALSNCDQELYKAMSIIKAEEKLIRQNPRLFDIDRDDYHNNFQYGFIHSDEYTSREITLVYCEPMQNERWKQHGYVTGFIEWTEKGEEEVKPATVERVIVSDSKSFPWEP